MTQTLANLKAKKKKNGGFTLVELIIVIAIMAALVAIIAPQYVKYVEQSRVSADGSTADQIVNAVKVATVDTTTALAAGDTGTTVKWKNATTDSTITVAGTNKGAIESSLTQSLGVTFTSDVATLTNTTIKSSAHKAQTYTVTLVTDANSAPTVNSAWGTT